MGNEPDARFCIAVDESLYQVEFIAAISQFSKENWNRLMRDSNPFNRYEYLAALESSGCVCTKTGWTPMHMLVRKVNGDEIDDVIAVMPLYIKAHSYGEYIFDWAWADAYDRHQIPYYPKLLAAIPFTPVTGMRFGSIFEHTSLQQQALWQVVNQALTRCLVDYGFSSWHCLFLPRSQFTQLSKQQNLQRLSTQFHWFNRNYADFNHFLDSLTSRKRKDIKKERQKVSRVGLTFEFVEGDAVTTELWQHFYACYQSTYAKRSGHYGYLNLGFFEAIGSTLSEQIVLLLVRDPQRQIIVSALYFKSATHLYGRYWGSLIEMDVLHFEACYYQGIEYCIANKLQVFDAGAQGEHKVSRGFQPVETYSNHEVAHGEFRSAIESFTQQEAQNIKIYMQELKAKLPYKTEPK